MGILASGRDNNFSFFSGLPEKNDSFLKTSK